MQLQVLHFDKIYQYLQSLFAKIGHVSAGAKIVYTRGTFWATLAKIGRIFVSAHPVTLLDTVSFLV